MRHCLKAAAVALLGVWTLITPSPAAGEKPAAHGYWWRLQPPAGPIVRPPSVSEGGLYVARDAAGDQAISALRFVAQTGRTPERLTVEVTGGDGDAAVVACPSAAAWEPVEAGRWDSRPAAACDRLSVAAELIEGGAKLVVDLETLSQDGSVDIVLQPAEGAGPFSLQIAPPGESAFTTAAMPQPAAEPQPESPAERTPVAAPSFQERPEAVDLPAFEPPPLGFNAPAFEAPPAPEPPPAALAEDAIRDAEQPAAAALTTRARTRQPLALVAFAGVLGAWVWRMKKAVAESSAHRLAAGNVAFARKGDEPVPVVEAVLGSNA